MKGVNAKTAKRIFQLWDATFSSEEKSIKLDRSDGSFMPLYMECIGENDKFHFFSLCHYGEQNGDLMCDPEICYAISKWTVKYGEQKDWKSVWIGPYNFRNDYMGMNNEYLIFGDDGNIKSWVPRLYKDCVSYSSKWMDNVWNRQGIKGDFKI